jgi:acyl-coenzyme A thioesterase PaaI-like protein
MTESIDQLTNDGWEIVTDDGFIGLVGPFVKKSDADGIRLGFPTVAKHRNLRGVLQGGALMTFADRACGIAVRAATGARRTATVQLNVQFIDAVKIGEFIETRPVIIRETKQLVFMNGTLSVGSRVCAVVQGIWKLLRE